MCLAVTACAPTRPPLTLRDIDVPATAPETTAPVAASQSTDGARQAYTDYLKHADKGDHTREAALNRLAQLEFQIADKLRRDHDAAVEARSANPDDLAYQAQLDRTIELLTTSLRDYPAARNNDRLLYQLAKAYDQKGDWKSSLATLRQLAKAFPKSVHFVEAQFRVAEAAFSTGDYLAAEDAYTDVIGVRKGSNFYEKSLFKRGWCRYKQGNHDLALDDFIGAVTQHRFDDPANLEKSELEQFHEYFRAIALAVTNIGGAARLPELLARFSDFAHTYHVYSTIADMYLGQERYNDAAETMRRFVSGHARHERVPAAHEKIIEIWQASGFPKPTHDAVEHFFSAYNPASKYWTGAESQADTRKSTLASLRKYILLESAYFHSAYQKSHRADDLESARTWYERYLKHYSSFARHDNIHFLYAELLAQSGNGAAALPHYETAAYDGDLVLNRDAAYATVLASSRMFETAATSPERDAWLNRHLRYASLYGRHYPNDPRTAQVVLHAAETAYAQKQFERTIELAASIGDSAASEVQLRSGELRARSLLSLKRFAEAEETYQRLLGSGQVADRNRRELEDGLALSVYKQAEAARDTGKRWQAFSHFSRIVRVAPGSDIAATGLYDAIALAMKEEDWRNAIVAIRSFQATYPDHKYSGDVAKKLSVAYLKSNQDIKAAEALEKVADREKDRATKTAALWQAAQLHKTRNNHAEAIRLFGEYVRSYSDPYPQYLEAMYMLVEVHEASGNGAEADNWRRKIIDANSKAYKNQKNDRSQYIASTAAITLARKRHAEFNTHRLVAPLETSLKRKKTVMQDAVLLYGRASTVGVHETTTEATYAIADIYESFGKALLKSERPKNLKPKELEQYEILLEDQAFPFEAKAIEFHETNVARLKDGAYNDWIEKSLVKLRALFPVRYTRTEKIDPYFNVNR